MFGTYYGAASNGTGSGTKSECGGASRPPVMKLAQAYVPNQEFRDLLSPDKVFYAGTVFDQLYMPYDGRGKRK